MKWGKNALFVRWFAQNHDTTFSPNYLTGRHLPITEPAQSCYTRSLPRGLLGHKKSTLFSNFNPHHFVRTDILYNFVGPKQRDGAYRLALADPR